jgi:hypothetical protein
LTSPDPSRKLRGSRGELWSPARLVQIGAEGEGKMIDPKTNPSRSQPWAWTKDEDERLRAFVAQGASVTKVAAALKRKIVSVRTRARSIGCPFPPLRILRKKWADTPDNVQRRNT